MMLQTAKWSSDGYTYRMDMPVSKIDTENRLVSGWASLDNPDLQGDIVLSSASEKAFTKFRGNIREMHQPIAVGKMVSWRPDTYFDPATQKSYNGIFVTAYISKGAQATWEKVLDGTLQAFSIKGPIKDYDTQFAKDASGKQAALRVIKDYELEELSLVDSGGNQLANVVSFQKSVDGSVEATGIATTVEARSVFWCNTDNIAKASTEDQSACVVCGNAMVNIGWFENDGGEVTEKLAAVVAKYNAGTDNIIEKQVEPATTEGGVDVAENEKEVLTGSTGVVGDEPTVQGKVETQVDSSVDGGVDNSEVETKEDDAKAEKAADVSDTVEADDNDLTKLFATLKDTLDEGLQKNLTATTEAISNVQSKVDEITKAFESKVSELADNHAKLSESLAGIESKLDGVEKRVDNVVSDTAVKKSADLGGDAEATLKKNESGWGGRFLGVSTLSND